MIQRAAPKDYIYYIAAATFFVIIFLSIALVKFGIPGLPLRAMLSIILLAFISMTIPSSLGTSMARALPFFSVIAICAALGIFSSILNDTSVEAITRQVFEIHFQAAVGLVLGFCMIAACGPSTPAKIMIIVILISAAFAIPQAVQINFAWAVREFFQRIQPIDVSLDSIFLTARLRAMGLSYSPVHLGTQLCIAWACWASYTYWRYRGEYSSRYVLSLLAATVVFLVSALASGNRSPILGIIAFWVIFLLNRQPGIAIIVGLTALPAFAIVDDILQTLADAGIRSANVDNGSATNRQVLRAFGVMLLMDRPYGYGLTFNSPDLWAGYWDALKNYPNAVAIRVHPLHNYYLMMANKYGIGIFAVGAYIATLLLRNKQVLLAFLPYMTHIYYHNDGVLQADFLIWFVMPAIITMAATPQATPAKPHAPARRQTPEIPLPDGAR